MTPDELDAWHRQLMRQYGLIPDSHLAKLKLSGYGDKMNLLINGLKSLYWDRMPGWASLEDMVADHEARWPFSRPEMPRLVRGNDPYRAGDVKMPKRAYNVLNYAWHIAHHVHRRRYGTYSANPRWAGLLITAVAAHSPEMAELVAAETKRMRMTVEKV
jgi:hypothetical protein